MPNCPPSAEKSEDALFRSTVLHELTGHTNKTPEAIDREYEHALIGLTPAPCIKGWSQEQIVAHAATCGGHLFAVEVPQLVTDTLTDPALPFPLSDAAVTRLEALVAEHNGVPPEKICVEQAIVERGHQWNFYPETSPVLTGFDYLVE